GELRAGLRLAAERLDDIADRVVVEADLPARPAITWQPDPARGRLAALPPLARAEGEHALALVARVHEDLAGLLAVVHSLGDERDAGLPAAIAPPGGAAAAADALSWHEALKSSLALDSVVLRHALRVATVALASVVVIRALHLQRGYWASLTAILLLQPYLPATITRGLQRVGGTIAGGVLATLIAAVIHDPLGIAVIAILGAGVSASMLQLNYGLYALFLTPTFVLLAEVHARDSHLVELRITNTLLGAGLAVIGALVLWPVREQTQTADGLAGALDAAAGYLRAIFHAVTSHAPPHSTQIIAARRAAGRAFNHADLSLDRLVAEGPPPGVIEPRMAVITMTRRLAASLSAFGSARHVSDLGSGGPSLEAIATDAEAYLRAAATALRDRAAAPVYARHAALAEQLPALLAARVTRIDLQLSIIAEAVTRTLTAEATA
ncbi:MAG TPA: FUSC family protein, partial [Kofleriaceae bacterium]